jgi:hypothetical protein
MLYGVFLLCKYPLFFNPFKPEIRLNNLYITELTREVSVGLLVCCHIISMELKLENNLS